MYVIFLSGLMVYVSILVILFSMDIVHWYRTGTKFDIGYTEMAIMPGIPMVIVMMTVLGILTDHWYPENVISHMTALGLI